MPSVKAGKPYVIIGFRQAVHDYSHTTFPQNIRNCQNCHEGTTKGAQSDVYMTKPSRAACGSCHDDVNFATGENHKAGFFTDDTACATCHIPDSGDEFDASIKGAHTIPEKSKQLKGLNVKIVSVTNVVRGKTPTMVFKFTENDGTPVNGTTLNTFAPRYAGPTTSYRTVARGGTGSYDSITGLTSFTFKTPIDAAATGTLAFTTDAWRSVKLVRGDGGPDMTVREAVMNPISYVAVTGAVTPRRVVVGLANCNTCHDRLLAHGKSQRMNTEECVMCHNPAATDADRRPASEGAAESLSFQRMIHRIHSGEDLTNDFTTWASSAHNFNEILYPGDRRNCAKCHTSTSMNLPVAKDAAAVITPRDYFSPQGPGTAACLGCHDNRDAAAHAYLNTTTFAGQPAEACGACHGANSEWSVAKVHAR